MVPPGSFGEADAVFPANDAAHGEDAAEELIEDAVHLGVVGPGAGRCHEVDVDVAVTGMTEAGDTGRKYYA